MYEQFICESKLDAIYLHLDDLLLIIKMAEMGIYNYTWKISSIEPQHVRLQ